MNESSKESNGTAVKAEKMMSRVKDLTTNWKSIPTVIYTLINEYLSRTEFLRLLNTSKTVFLDVKRETIYYNLGSTASILFCKDTKFREFVLNQVYNPSKQISLDLFSHYQRNLHTFYQNAINVHKLMIRDLDRVTSVDLYGTIEELTIQNFEKLKIIQNFEKVKIFKIYDCPKFQSLSYRSDCLQDVLIANCPSLRNTRGLERVPVLSFHFCRGLHDISNLGKHQKQLSLKGCIRLASVNHLGNIPELQIVDCPNVVDVSGLGNVPNLEINNCPAISLDSLSLLNRNKKLKLALVPLHSYYHTGDCEKIELVSLPLEDLSKGDLSGCKEFQLRFCERVIDVSPLRHIDNVYLFRCHQIVDISCLGGVQTLRVEVCRGITNLNGLGLIPNLSVYLCERLADISQLGQNRNVVISTCIRIEDFSSLGSVESVAVIDCPQLITAAPLQNVSYLKLERCNQLEDVSMLGRVKSLQLIYCHRIESLRGLETVEKLVVIGGMEKDTAGLEKKRSVVIK